MKKNIHPSLLQRKIIHFDMDCFYAAVEVRDNPRLKGLPLVVGGNPDSRGVVATCSYEARRFGIHSAMASSVAYRMCPKAIFVRPNFEKYKEASLAIREIFKRYTDKIEPLSLDEAYLDVTEHNMFAVQIAKRIKTEIQNETGLTGSAGVAPNKLIAKIASDFHKPDGLTVVLPHQAKDFMGQLKLRKINGVGPATEKKLMKEELQFCSDIWPLSDEELEFRLGSRLGSWLSLRSRGIDERPVESTWVRKSLGSEKTFAEDFLDRDRIKVEIEKISEKVSDLLLKKNISGKTVTLKVKYSDFQRITRAKTLVESTNSKGIIFDSAFLLLGKTEIGQKPIRLIGITVSNFLDKTS